MKSDLDKSIEKMQATMKELERKQEEIKEFETGFTEMKFECFEDQGPSLLLLSIPALTLLFLSICTLLFGISPVLTVLTIIYALGLFVAIPAMVIAEDASIGFAYTILGVFLTALNIIFTDSSWHGLLQQ
jgi:hypothetical protein